MRALELFLALQDQWRFASGFAAAQLVGIDSANIEAELRMRNVPRAERAELLEDLRVMIRAYMKVANRRG